MLQDSQEVTITVRVTRIGANSVQACVNNFKVRVTSNEHRALIAERTGISRYVRFSEQPGARSASVLAKVLNAIIAAVYLDCGGTNDIVLRMMHHLG